MGVNSNIPGVTGGGGGTPTSYTCEIDVTYTSEDNLTYANKAEFSVVECPDIPLNSDKDFWNCNLCGNDERYEQPVIDGDEVYMQFKANDPAITRYQTFLFDKDDNIIEHADDEAITLFTTNDGINNYLNVKLTISEIPATCFYMKLFAFRCDIDAEDLADCREAKIASGMGIQEAWHDCLLELCPADYDGYYTELYRKTNAECEETILVEGEYGDGHDCAGNFYGPNLDFSRFVMRVRIPGSIEQIDLDIEETLVNNTRRTSKMTEVYRMKSFKIPPSEAVKVYVALAGKTFSVDGLNYVSASKVSKNNEEGRMWILDVTMSRECDEIDFACNT